MNIKNIIIYSKARKRFLEDNPIDVVSLFVFGIIQPATLIHHANGRNGFNYVDINRFIATTQKGDNWIHAHPDLSKELGFLCHSYYQPKPIKRHPRKRPRIV